MTQPDIDTHSNRHTGGPFLLLWVILVATYFSAHSTFYWSDFRNYSSMIPIRHWQWQLLHFATWGILLPLCCLALLIQLVRLRPPVKWRLRDVVYVVCLQMTAAAAMFLIVVFLPESEKQINRPWLDLLLQFIILIVLPTCIGITLLLYFRERFYRRAS